MSSDVAGGVSELHRSVENKTTDLESAFALMKREFEKEALHRFPRLSRVPDTSVRRFLRYFVTLETSEAESLKTAVAHRALYFFDCGVALTDQSALAAGASAIERKASAIAQMGDWSSISIKTLKMAVAMSRSNHPSMVSQMRGCSIPDEVVRWLDSLTSCKAPDLRRLVKKAFASDLGLSGRNRGGGVWYYSHDEAHDSPGVEIDYGGRFGQQLRYSVYTRRRLPGDPPSKLTFESILGAGSGDWDFITESTAEQDVALLVELVGHVMELSRQLRILK